MNENDIKKIKLCFKFAVIIIIVYWALNNITTVSNGLNYIISIISPFLLGVLFALIINIPMKFFEKKIKINNKSKARILSLLLATILSVLIIILIITLIIPQLWNTIQIFIDQIPKYKEQIETLLQNSNIDYKNINYESIVNALDTMKGSLNTNI